MLNNATVRFRKHCDEDIPGIEKELDNTMCGECRQRRHAPVASKFCRFDGVYCHFQHPLYAALWVAWNDLADRHIERGCISLVT